MEYKFEDVFNNEIIFLDVQGSSHDEALKNVSNLLQQKGYVEDAKKFEDALIYRENLISTGLSDGIAVPHGVSSTVQRPFVSIVRLKNEIDWHALDNKGVKILFIIGSPKNERQCQVDFLQNICSWSLDDNIKNVILNANDANQILEVLKTKEF